MKIYFVKRPFVDNLKVILRKPQKIWKRGDPKNKSRRNVFISRWHNTREKGCTSRDSIFSVEIIQFKVAQFPGRYFETVYVVSCLLATLFSVQRVLERKRFADWIHNLPNDYLIVYTWKDFRRKTAVEERWCFATSSSFSRVSFGKQWWFHWI